MAQSTLSHYYRHHTPTLLIIITAIVIVMASMLPMNLCASKITTSTFTFSQDDIDKSNEHAKQNGRGPGYGIALVLREEAKRQQQQPPQDPIPSTWVAATTARRAAICKNQHAQIQHTNINSQQELPPPRRPLFPPTRKIVENRPRNPHDPRRPEFLLREIEKLRRQLGGYFISGRKNSRHDNYNKVEEDDEKNGSSNTPDEMSSSDDGP